jgi:hypothetical protein
VHLRLGALAQAPRRGGVRAVGKKRIHIRGGDTPTRGELAKCLGGVVVLG